MSVILMILGFIWWWPLGLAVLAFMIGRRRFGRRPLYAVDGQTPDANYCGGRWERKIARMQNKMERYQMRAGWFSPSSSGNHAFDDYRSETLRRLEDEQREFKDFLERLRFAKDRAEFDQFMADRRSHPVETPSQNPPPPPASHN